MRKHLCPPRQDLRGIGNEPDYRFSLANERTMLAYLRTSLALMAAGVALLQLSAQPLDVAAGIVLVLMGAAVAAVSYRRWWRVEAALRRAQPLPFNQLPTLLPLILVCTGAVAIIGHLP